jgi:uncharacterized protein Usg
MMSDFREALSDYRLTTVEIIYHLPDHSSLLQTYIWQEFDLAPNFPKLQSFLDFWNQSIEGKIHSIRISQAPSLIPNNIGYGQCSLSIN